AREPMPGLREPAARVRVARHFLGEPDAAVADEDVGSRNQLVDLARRPAAVRADGIAPLVARPPDALPPAAAGAVDNLLHALVAQPERLRDLAQRAPSQVQAPDRGVVVGARELRLALRVGQLAPIVARPLQELLVEHHVPSCLSTIDSIVYQS